MAGSLESVRSNVATQSVVSPVGVEVTSSQRRGSYRGESVKSTQENSKLSRASDEARSTGGPSAKIDLRTAHVRSMRQGQATSSQATSRIAEYHDKLPDMPSDEKLQHLAQEFETILAQMPPMHLTEHVGKHVAEQRHGLDNAKQDETSASEGEETEAETNEQQSAAGGERQDPSANAAYRSTVEQVRQQILSKLQEFDGDVTHQFAALDILSGQFEEAGIAAPFLDALDLARQSFEEPGIARDVRAGLASAAIAQKAAATLETDASTVRNAYRDVLREQTDLGGLFDQLKRFDLNGKFESVINTFLAIAGRDLEAVDHSTDPAFLHGLVRELSKLKTMNTVLDLSKEIIRTVERLMPRPERGQLKSDQLTSGVLHFAATVGATPRDARQMIQGTESMSPQTRVLLGNGMKDLHAAVPDDVFPSVQARSQQKAAMMGLLDQLVDDEERAHEAG